MARLLNLEDYFIAITLLIQKRSKDPRTKVGACVVNNDNKIIGTGYNGMPNNFSESDSNWMRENKHNYVCHGELNAIVNSPDVRNCTMYVGLHPCNVCAKLIIQSGMKEVIYITDRTEATFQTAEKMFQAAKKILAVSKYQGNVKNVVIKTRNGDEFNSFLNWHDYFIAITLLVAKRSENPSKKVGACVVNNENRIIGTGYNGMPNGITNNDNFIEINDNWNAEPKHSFECHAAVNAILNSTNVRNCILYVGRIPCNECAKLIIQSGIKEVMYVKDDDVTEEELTDETKRMFGEVKIWLSKYNGKIADVVIEYED